MPTLGVFAAISDENSRILCVRMNYATRAWTTPGGRVEPGESLESAVAREVLKGLARSPFGMVAFGGGNGIARSLPFLKMIGRPLEEVHYVGDLDYHGLKIAQRAQRAALQMDIPIKPATALHRAMLASASAFGCPDGWPIEDQSPPKPETVQKVIPFLDAGISARVSSILVKGNRIPEEVLGPGELTALWT